MKDKIRETLKFQDLTPEEKERRGILCRLYGPCADFEAPTRNGRKYSDEVWEKVFNENEIVKELLANGGIPGEAQHPTDREEVDVEKIALMMPEAPKRGEDGKLIAFFDVQDTPCGRILYQLAKYGFKLGISSRGTGDIITDENGEECVDPETYDFTCFDAVIIPSVKDARLTMVESLNSKPTLKQSLQESLNKATPGDRKIMEETLKELNIDIVESNSENCDNKEKVELKEDLNTKKEEVSDTESSALVKSLQETLQSKLQLEKQLQELQEKLAVSDTKTKKLEEELQKHKATVIRLSGIAQSNKQLKEENQTLKEQLETQSTKIKNQSSRISKLAEKLTNSTNSSKQLNENLDNTNEKLNNLNEKYVAEKKEYENKINKLNEQLLDTKASFESKEKEYASKLSKSVKLIEKYKNYVVSVVDEYIKSKAVMLGISENEIKNRLNESYTIEDINKVCDDLQNYNLRISRLPFSVTKDTKVKITESKKSQYEPISPEDDIEALEKFIKG